jgi:hypothetical protein
MTVYVDDMKVQFKSKNRPDRTYVMSHMIADTEEELHAMAVKIGIAHKWHHGDHYDITQEQRALAIKDGARAITMGQLACMAGLRQRGLPMGAPENAEAAFLAVFDGDKAVREQGGSSE